MTKEKIQKNLDIIQHSFHQLDESSQTKKLEEINAAIAAFVRSENNDNDAIDGIFITLAEIAESVQEDFEELVGISNGKNTFARALERLSQAVIPQRIGNENILNRCIRNISFKIKQILPRSKMVDIKKERMKVRRKVVYFSRKGRLNFVQIFYPDKNCRDKIISIVKVKKSC